MHLIDYGHMQDGVLYHGTLSDLDGVPKATWSYEKGGKKVTHDQPIDLPTFPLAVEPHRQARCISAEPRARSGPASRPNRRSCGQHHFRRQGEPTAGLLSPCRPRKSDPQFLSWLKSLNIPKGSISPQPPELPVRGRPKEPSPLRGGAGEGLREVLRQGVDGRSRQGTPGAGDRHLHV